MIELAVLGLLIAVLVGSIRVIRPNEKRMQREGSEDGAETGAGS